MSGAEAVLVDVALFPSDENKPGRLSSKNAASTTALIPNKTPSRTPLRLVDGVRDVATTLACSDVLRSIFSCTARISPLEGRQVMPLSSASANAPADWWRAAGDLERTFFSA